MSAAKKTPASERRIKAAEATPQKRMKEAKAKLEELNATLPAPAVDPKQYIADCEEMGTLRASIGEIPVPMTLNEICRLMGPECRAENFAASALDTLASQLYAVAGLAERDGSYDGWQVVENIVDRMKCAGEVVTWLESETTELPGVTP